jgi:hypothetical protein
MTGERETGDSMAESKKRVLTKNRQISCERSRRDMTGIPINKLQAIPDGDGTLLDHSMVLYGSAMSDGNQHNHGPLLIILAGGASGQLKGGRHIRNAKDTTMSNLLVAMLDKLGIPTEKFGDSTGMLSL